MSIVSNSTGVWSYELRYSDVVVISVVGSIVSTSILIISTWVLCHICISRLRSVEEEDNPGRFSSVLLVRTEPPLAQSSHGVDLRTSNEAEEMSEELSNSETSTEPMKSHDIEGVGIDSYMDLDLDLDLEQQRLGR